MSEQFTKASRVVAKQDFDEVFRFGRVIVMPTIVLHFLADPESIRGLRLGLSVSKKCGNAPTRNRWKRLIREAFRRSAIRHSVAGRIVIRPRKGAQPVFHEIEMGVNKALRKLMHFANPN